LIWVTAAVSRLFMRNFGRLKVAAVAMIMMTVMTISSSMSVKPRRFRLRKVSLIAPVSLGFSLLGYTTPCQS